MEEKIDIADEIEKFYEKWLMEEYSDEIRNKDDFIDKIMKGHRYDEFVEKFVR